MSRSVKARQTIIAAARTPVPLTPLRKLIRLPIVDAMPVLTGGPAAIRLSPDVVSLEYVYHPKHTSVASRQFMGQYAPQIAYNNPQIPFTFTRLGKAPVIKSASADGEQPAAVPPKVQTTADATLEESAAEVEEPAAEAASDAEPQLAKDELAPSSLILSLRNGQTRTIQTKETTLDTILAELLNSSTTPGAAQLRAPKALPVIEAPVEGAAAAAAQPTAA